MTRRLLRSLWSIVLFWLDLKKLICVSGLVNQEMGCPHVSFSQEGGATRNKRVFIGHPHFSPFGVAQRYSQSHHNGAQTGHPIHALSGQELNSARPFGVDGLPPAHGERRPSPGMAASP